MSAVRWLQTGCLYQPHDFFTQVKNNSHLFAGLASGTFSHGEGWHFERLGQFLERADKTSRILDVKYFILLPKMEYVGTAYDNAQWAAGAQVGQRFGDVPQAFFTALHLPRLPNFCFLIANFPARFITA